MDLQITMSHDIISKQWPDAKPSGVTFSEKYGISINLNFCLKVIVWTEKDKPVEARTLYFNALKIGNLSKDDVFFAFKFVPKFWNTRIEMFDEN